jgi:monothiol glutaredoxin
MWLFCTCCSNFNGINILEDEALRQGIKEFSNWPTIPQIYIDGEFIGGCDIFTEMFTDGELKELLITKNLIS